MDGFKAKYNEQGLREIYNKQPNDLLNKESELNKEYIKYKENVDKICITSKAFDKNIEDIGLLIKKISTPDIEKYKSWKIDEILAWIQGLENGRYVKHINKLKMGFIKSEIIGEDLPELTKQDLAITPFEIGSFRDRKQLEEHFQSLLGGDDVGMVAFGGVEDNEGAQTELI